MTTTLQTRRINKLRLKPPHRRSAVRSSRGRRSRHPRHRSLLLSHRFLKQHKILLSLSPVPRPTQKQGTHSRSLWQEVIQRRHQPKVSQPTTHSSGRNNKRPPAPLNPSKPSRPAARLESDPKKTTGLSSAQTKKTTPPMKKALAPATLATSPPSSSAPWALRGLCPQPAAQAPHQRVLHQSTILPLLRRHLRLCQLAVLHLHHPSQASVARLRLPRCQEWGEPLAALRHHRLCQHRVLRQEPRDQQRCWVRFRWGSS